MNFEDFSISYMGCSTQTNLIQNQDFNVVHVHRGGVGQVVDHSSRRANHDIRPCSQLGFLQPAEVAVAVAVGSSSSSKQ